MVAMLGHPLQRRGRSCGARLLIVGACLLALSCLSHQRQAFALSSLPDRNDVGRRQTLLAGLGLAAAGFGVEPARAEQAWQLKLPRAWRVVLQNQQPPPEMRIPTTLVAAGNADQGGELSVVRAPLNTDKADKNFAAAKDLVDYFSATPAASIDKAVDAVLVSIKNDPGLSKFTMAVKPSVQTKAGARYVDFTYESSLCAPPGVVTKGVKGDICQSMQDNSELPLVGRRNKIIMTVINEGTAKAPLWYLWLVNIAGDGQGDWGRVSEAVNEISSSFLVGDPDALEKAMTVEVTPEQRKAITEMNDQGLNEALDKNKLTLEQLQSLKVK